MIVVSAANLVALADLPYGYYQLLRIVVTGVAIWVALACHARSWNISTAVFGLVAILYNPLFKIHLERDVHEPVNIVVALLFAVTTFVFWKHDAQ